MAHTSVLRRTAASLQLVASSFASYLPANAARIAVLRAIGLRTGRGCVVHHGVAMRAAHKIRVGDDTWLDEHVRLDGRGGLVVGSHVSMGAGVQVWTAQHDWRAADFAYTSAPVTVGDRAWVCARAVVLPGVSIGEGAVIAAGAVVVDDVPAWTVAAGVPARVVAERPAGQRYVLESRRNKLFWW